MVVFYVFALFLFFQRSITFTEHSKVLPFLALCDRRHVIMQQIEFHFEFRLQRKMFLVLFVHLLYFWDSYFMCGYHEQRYFAKFNNGIMKLKDAPLPYTSYAVAKKALWRKNGLQKTSQFV